MGSVDLAHRCPLCGHIGRGGYACDHIGYPTCEVCNTKPRGAFKGFTATQLKMDQLQSILGKHPSQLRETLEFGGNLRIVASFLVPKQDQVDALLFS